MANYGLVLSAAPESDKSAYTHRILKLAEALEQRSFKIDYFFNPDHFPLDTETTASLFMPLWLSTLKKYDFIYCGAQEAAQSLYFCKPFLNSKIIVDVHGDLRAQSALAREVESNGRITSASWRVKMIDSMGMQVADHILTVCKPQVLDYLEAGIPNEKMSLIRNGVDLELFNFMPQPSDPEFTFAYIGEFQVWQGIDNLIQAFSLMQNKNARLLLIGFRDTDSELKRSFREQFGDRVELVDRTDRPTLIRYVQSAAILMIPRIQHQAIRNAFPTKFAEYAAMGRPIFVNDVDETADFVREYQCGFVSEPIPSAMAQIMDLAADASNQELAQMGKRSRQMAEENFSWDIIGDAYASVIGNLLGRKSSS